VAYTLKGGYNSGFSSISGSSAIHGSITISAGTVVFDNIVIL